MGHIDTARVTSMVGTFSGASSFNGDLSSWNIDQVTSMKSMFLDASSSNGDLSNYDCEH